jgi:hypothetical protein
MELDFDTIIKERQKEQRKIPRQQKRRNEKVLMINFMKNF